MNTCRRQLTTPLLVALLAGAAVLAQTADQITIETTRLADHVYMLVGAGGNIGVSVGRDGVLLIDTQYAPLTDKIVAAVRELSDQPVRFIINTHWHFDHVGGNENFAKRGAVIVAHENLRQRMVTGSLLKPFGRQVPPAPPAALPVVTYRNAMTFHWNGDDVQLVHVAPAHTDGDTFIYFRQANVLHAGDVYFNGMYPYIDVVAGGSIDGLIAGVDQILRLVNDDTKIIPGHGPLSGVKELRAYRDMLKTVSDRVGTQVRAGKSRDEVIASKPTRDLDAQWKAEVMQPDDWVGIVYDGFKK